MADTYVGFTDNGGDYPAPVSVPWGTFIPTVIADIKDEAMVRAGAPDHRLVVRILEGTGVPGAVLSGTLQKLTDVSHIAIYTDLTIDKPGSGYQLTWSDLDNPALIGVPTPAFTMEAEPLTPLAPLYPATNTLPLLSDPTSRYRKLKTDMERSDQIVVAEMLLGLVEPVYSGRKGSEIQYAIALQVNFQLDQGFITAQQLKSISVGTPASHTTAYRDRYLHPGAAAIVARVTETAVVGFSAPPLGV